MKPNNIVSLEKFRKEQEEDGLVKCASCGKRILPFSVRCEFCGIHFQGTAEDFAKEGYNRPLLFWFSKFILLSKAIILLISLLIYIGLRI